MFAEDFETWKAKLNVKGCCCLFNHTRFDEPRQNVITVSIRITNATSSRHTISTVFFTSHHACLHTDRWRWRHRSILRFAPRPGPWSVRLSNLSIELLRGQVARLQDNITTIWRLHIYTHSHVREPRRSTKERRTMGLHRGQHESPTRRQR